MGTSQQVNSAANYKVRTSNNAAGEQLQHVRLDLGVGAAEAQAAGAVPVSGTLAISNFGGLVPESYDEIQLTYTGTDLTGVVYKLATVTVATLTLAYTAHVLDSVTRT